MELVNAASRAIAFQTLDAFRGCELAMSTSCLFCQIATGSITARIFWDSETHVAFLTPYPNTPGFTVVASRAHLQSDIFGLDDVDFEAICSAAKQVSGLLRTRLEVARVGCVFEGYGINHAHVKLVPMHGIASGPWEPISSADTDRKFYESYPGFIASHDGPRMDDNSLDEVFRKLLD
jgi:histidine triad (HIT) family protein